jgi:hypothetical protein
MMACIVFFYGELAQVRVYKVTLSYFTSTVDNES